MTMVRLHSRKKKPPINLDMVPPLLMLSKVHVIRPPIDDPVDDPVVTHDDETLYSTHDVAARFSRLRLHLVEQEVPLLSWESRSHRNSHTAIRHTPSLR